MKPPIMRAVSERLGQIKVLIADDDRRIAHLVKDVLKSLGFQHISIVHDGSEALQKLHTEEFHLVITDWHMVPMDGMTMVELLRRDERSPNRFIAIIMLTGNAEKMHVEAARDAGVTEFVVKPFTVRALCDRIVALIEDPRSFIMCRAFVGPDRRRKSGEPPQGSDKRRRKHGRK